MVVNDVRGRRRRFNLMHSISNSKPCEQWFDINEFNLASLKMIIISDTLKSFAILLREI